MKGNRIKELRKNAKYTQSELGEKLGVVKQTISSWENDISEPNDDMLIRLCNTLGTTPGYLLGTIDSDIPIKTSSVSKTMIGHYIYSNGYSSEELSKELGISEDLLVSYINDYKDIPYELLSLLSNILKVSTDCLLGISNTNRSKDLDNIIPFKYNTAISNRIKKLCIQTKIDIHSSFLENLLCLSNKEIYYMIEYGFIPHIDVLIKLADLFNVSTDYLLCKVDIQTEKVVQTFTQLNEDNKDIIVGEIKKTLKNQRYEESVAADSSLKKTGTENQGK